MTPVHCTSRVSSPPYAARHSSACCADGSAWSRGLPSTCQAGSPRPQGVRAAVAQQVQELRAELLVERLVAHDGHGVLRRAGQRAQVRALAGCPPLLPPCRMGQYVSQQPGQRLLAPPPARFLERHAKAGCPVLPGSGWSQGPGQGFELPSAAASLSLCCSACLYFCPAHILCEQDARFSLRQVLHIRQCSLT